MKTEKNYERKRVIYDPLYKCYRCQRQNGEGDWNDSGRKLSIRQIYQIVWYSPPDVIVDGTILKSIGDYVHEAERKKREHIKTNLNGERH